MTNRTPRPTGRPVTVANGPVLQDHRIDGRAVLPAVEGLQLLAREVQVADPQAAVRNSRDAAFLRFLELPAESPTIDAFVELRRESDGGLAAALSTRGAAGSAGVVRSREYLHATFVPAPAPPAMPLDLAAAPAGPLFAIDPQRLYDELVPFGPAWRNARGPIVLGADGATALLAAPAGDTTRPPLGSPFPLDAAFHVACAWGQRHVGRVLFPGGYARRHVVRPIEAGSTTFCRIAAVARGVDEATFDIRIFDLEGTLCETVLGVRMVDVLHGKGPVPPDIRAGAAALDPLVSFRDGCAALALVELEPVAPFIDRLWAPRERSRLPELGDKRARAFLAARLALKRAARALGGAAAEAPAEAIETVAADLEHPCVEGPGLAPDAWHCAAAHDARFAVAMVADHPIGIDVEPLGGRALRGTELFASPAEQALINAAADPADAALRAWTIKEAASKALDVPLALAWREAEVTALGPERSRATIRGAMVEARHVLFEEHLFTMLALPDGGAASR
jgi:phosphopantetheinyl transferase (holo-ACP synthase)